MANENKRLARELARLQEDLGPYHQQPSRRPLGRLNLDDSAGEDNSSVYSDTSTGSSGADSMSQRNRSGRGSNRNNGSSHGEHGEEAQMWETCKAQLAEIVAGVNNENENLGKLVDKDKQAGSVDPEKVPNELLKEMEQLCRNGVKFSEGNVSSIKNVMEQLKIIRAVLVAKEPAESGPSAPTSKRGARDSSAAAAASLYDFDAAGDSPAPSPIGSSSRKLGDRSSNRDRDSIPPKAESVEPQGSTGTAAGSSASTTSAATSNLNKSKVVFSRGDEVAFKPKAVGELVPEWILCEVAQVLGEGKSRRYKVLDIEPDDQGKTKEYRTSASSMIPITPASQASSLKDWNAGQIVLALYPDSTTFYKAEVYSMKGQGYVNLKFEGENDSTTLQSVERRYVVEYRA